MWANEFSNGGVGVADTAPEAPIPEAKPDWKLLAALDNGFGLLTGLLDSASDIDAAGAVAASFNELPLNALNPVGICGGRIPPLATPEPAVGIPVVGSPSPLGGVDIVGCGVRPL